MTSEAEGNRDPESGHAIAATLYAEVTERAWGRLRRLVKISGEEIWTDVEALWCAADLIERLEAEVRRLRGWSVGVGASGADRAVVSALRQCDEACADFLVKEGLATEEVAGARSGPTNPYLDRVCAASSSPAKQPSGRYRLFRGLDGGGVAEGDFDYLDDILVALQALGYHEWWVALDFATGDVADRLSGVSSLSGSARRAPVNDKGA
jgi:hypothetical protein